MANQVDRRSAASKSWLYLMSLLLILSVVAAGAALYYQHKHPNHKTLTSQKQVLKEVKSAKSIKDSYDVIVVGTDPEGITAAVSAARNGLSTLLVDGRDREILGGLMTLGWLNTIDMNYTPEQPMLGGKHSFFNKGLFAEWYNQVEGDSFDVITAANAFNEMVKKEKNIDLLLKTKAIEPLLASGNVGNSLLQGINVTKADGSKQTIRAQSVIDATQDADIATAAGVPYTYGRQDIGDPNSKMAVTLVFRLKNVTPDVWKQIKKRLNDDNDGGTGANEVSAWGYGELYNYPEVNKGRVKMRGLNIGRQNNDTALINALQIFGIDGVDPKSRQDAFEIGKKELPHVIDFIKKKYPEFASVELDATAPELYVRETRHIQGEYRLSMMDLLENRDQWDRIAFGSYQIDIQRTSAADNGAIVSHPIQYAVPFRSIVPLKVDGLLVVGRSSSYDTLPHGSARVIPLGMAEGEAAGAAVKVAQEKKLTFRQLSSSKDDISALQERINKQGMDVKPFVIKPQPYMLHKDYDGLKAVVGMGLWTGSYNNDFKLDEASNPERMLNLVLGTKRNIPNGFQGDAKPATAKLDDSAKKGALSLDQAAYTITLALGSNASAGNALGELTQKGLISQASVNLIGNKQSLSNGDTFMLIKDVKEALGKK
jgi:hypothetical protein